MALYSRPFDYDPLTGIRRTFHYDPDRDGFTIETVQEVGNITEDSKALYAMKDERARWGEMEHVAHIPAVLATKLKKAGILDDEKALRRWLDDPDNRHFRTRPGSLSR